jgi:hypothetical protein
VAITDLFINNAEDRSVVYPSWVCRIGSDGFVDETFPPVSILQLTTAIKPRKVSRSAGGANADYASYEWIDGTPLTNRLLQPGKFSKMSDVLLPSRQFLGFDDQVYLDLMEEGSEFAASFAASYLNVTYGTNVRLIVGDYVTESESVDATETLNAQVSVSESMYGTTCDGMQYVKMVDAEDLEEGEDPERPGIEVSEEIVFNPEIDGEVRGNKSSNFQTQNHYWIIPEVSESAALQDELGQSVSMWSLPEAIVAVCRMMNEEEVYIRNPVIDEESELWTGAPEIKNLRLQTGFYLPYYLDAILHPAGYNWWLDPETEKLPQGDGPETQWKYERPIIRIFRKGWSPDPPKELNFQAPGSTLDLSESNVNQYRIDRKISDAYNCVRVLGDKIRVEMTFRLYPGWRNSEDALTPDELAISDGDQYAEHKTAHRLWIANEWLGWSDNRTGAYEVGLNLVALALGTYSLTGNGQNYPVLRPKLILEPPLTYQGSGDDKVRRDILLEYSIDSGVTWTEVSSKIGGWAVLGDQVGIIFTDDKPPQDIWDAFQDETLRMRVTGTVASPTNYYNYDTDTPDFNDSSAIMRARRLVLDRSSEFRHWFVLGKNNPAGSGIGGTNDSVLKDDVAGAETHDDRQALYDFAAATLRNVMHAEYDADFTLPGWHTEYKIGDLLSKINGREVGLNQSADAEDPRYLQITGIEWELSDDDGPTTRIIVDRGINDVKRTATPEFGPVPITEIVAYEVEAIMRSEALKMDSMSNTGPSAMDNLRGTIR